MRWTGGHSWVSIGALAGVILCSAGALAQIAVPSGYSAGTAGASCAGLGQQYAWPDANGQILKCVSNVWTVVGQSVAPAGSDGQVQYNSAGVMGADQNFSYTANTGILSLGTSAAAPGGLLFGGMNGISFPTTDAAGGGSIAIGYQALRTENSLASKTYANTIIGYGALSSAGMTSAATSDTALGYKALFSNQTGSNNTVMGSNSATAVTTASSNTAIGNQALGRTTTGSTNTAVGSQALIGAVSNSLFGSVGVGVLSGAALTTGGYETLIGYNAGSSITSGNSNVAIGSAVASTTLTTGSNNILIGNDSTTDTFSSSTSSAIAIGFGAKAGTGDIAIGYQANLTPVADNTGNIAIGSQVMSATLTTAAINNTVVGNQAGKILTSGSQNTFFGSGAGVSATTAIGDVLVGYSASTISGINSFSVVVGSLARAHANSVSVGASVNGGSANGGSNNTSVGYSAAYNLGVTTGNVAIGSTAMYGNNANRISGGSNTVVGSNAAYFLQGTSANNTILGAAVASTTLTTGSNNVLIGTGSAVDTPTATTNNFLNIGNLIYGTSIGTAATPGNVGIGTTTPQGLLDIYSTTKGMLSPRMTTAQRNAISSPATGLTIYNTDTLEMETYNGATYGWEAIGAGALDAGGSTTQLQYNNGGALGGTAGLTWDSTNQTMTLASAANPAASTLTITGGAITGATSYPALNIAQTWNNASTVFTGILANITNTASSSSSILMDLQVGGQTKFRVRSNGIASAVGGFSSSSTSTAYDISASASTGTGYNDNVASLTTGYGFNANDTNAAANNAFSGNYINIAPIRTVTQTINDTGHFLSLVRANSVNSSGKTYTISGDLANLSSNCTQTVGTCVDTASILTLNQQNASASGTVLNVTNSGTGAAATFSGGNVGIGTTSPNGKLEVDGTSVNVIMNATSGNPQLSMQKAGTTQSQWLDDGSSAIVSNIGYTAGVYLPHASNGWLGLSDVRLKKDIKPLTVLDRVRDYRAVSFAWKVSDKRDIGVIAQEIYRVFPEVVNRGSDSGTVSKITDKGVWGVRYDLLGALALEGVKELKADNDKLRAANDNEAAQIKDLTARLDVLEAARH